MVFIELAGTNLTGMHVERAMLHSAIFIELAGTNLTGMHVERAMLHSAIRALFFFPNRLPFPLAIKMLSNGGRLPFLLAIFSQ